MAHPTLLDGCLQLLAASLFNENATDLYLPVGCDSFRLYAPLEDHIFAHWQETEITDSGRSGHLQVLSPSGKLLADIQGLHYRKTTAHAFKHMLSHELSVDEWIYEWVWQEHTCEEVDLPMGHWLIVGDPTDTKKIIGLIESKGGSYRSINPEELVSLLDTENPRGILHVASSADTISAAQDFGSKSFLQLTQTVIQLNRKIPLFLIDPNTLENSPLNGLFKTALLEHPEIEMKQIVLGSDWDPETFLKALFAKEDESIFEIREGKIYVPRLFRQNEAKGQTARAGSSVR